MFVVALGCVWVVLRFLSVDDAPQLHGDAMDAIHVEVDAFSGLPNPAWTLSPEDGDRLRERLALLQPSVSQEKLPDGLGYRGVRVVGLDDYGEIVACSGIVQGARHGKTIRWSDKDRKLERFLLETANRYLEDAGQVDVIDRIRRDVAP
jgi:hypothetical protein